jgi:hypothetical protein
MDKETFEKAIELYNEMQCIKTRRMYSGIDKLTDETVEKLSLDEMRQYISYMDDEQRQRIHAVVKECLLELIHSNALEEIEKEIEKL